MRYPALMTAIVLIAAAGCSRQPDQPGAISADDARQLNEAAAMLDANSVDTNTVVADAGDGSTDNASTE